MGVAGIAGGVTAAASVASAANSIASGSPSGGAFGSYGGNPATYIPEGQPAADSLYQSIFNGQSSAANSVPGMVDPIYAQALQALSNNPYSATAQSGADNAAQYGTGTLFPQQAAGATSLFGAGNQVLGTAFDPQNALYNQTLQNVQGQSNVANAQSGVQGPAAAGITDNNLNNFNLNWDNNQLARQTQGIQSAGQAYAGGSGLGGAGLTNLTTSAALPNAVYTGLNNQLNTAGNDYSSGITNSLAADNQVQNWLQSYLQLGQSATGLAQKGQQLGNAQSDLIGQQLGSSLNSLANNQGLANLFGNSGSAAGLSTYNSFDPSSYSSPDVANSDIAAFYGQ